MELTLSTVDVLHDHLRRVVRRQVDFTSPGVYVLVCGDDNEVLVAANFTEVDSVDAFAATVRIFTEHRLGDGLVIIRTRPGRSDLTPADRACFRVAHTLCVRDEMRLVGVHVLTPTGERQVQLDDVL